MNQNKSTVLEWLCCGLLMDAELHEQHRFSEMGTNFDEFNEQVCRTDITNPDFHIGINFWDSWVDQCRHGFRQNFYSQITPDLWPKLAKEIVHDLQDGNPISNPLILRNFDLRKR